MVTKDHWRSVMERRPGDPGIGRRALVRTAEFAVLVSCAAVVGAVIGFLAWGDAAAGAVAGIITGVILGLPLAFVEDPGRPRGKRWLGDPPRGNIHEPPYGKGGRG
jgi:hypothetical protein